MKNLHKKIGAMVLAGMVVLGGVAASGVNSFAASGKAAVKVSQEQKVRNIIKDRGNLLGANSDEKEIDNIKNEKYKNKKWKKRQVSGVKGLCEIPFVLSKAKNSPWEVIKVEWKGIYYLIEVIK